MIPCFIQYYNRFLARVVLVPFAHHAPAASIDTLDEILGEAHLALPQMIKVKGANVLAFKHFVYPLDWECS